jgi:sulfate adenylyltransferase
MTIDDQIFPIPIVCRMAAEVAIGSVIELRSQTGILHAILTVSECWKIDLDQEHTSVFGCTDNTHPYIRYVNDRGLSWTVYGPIEYKSAAYHNTFLKYRSNSFSTSSLDTTPLIGFQTRNPLHRSHIELIKKCVERVPNAALLLNPVEGVTQECDVPFPVRMKCYKEVLPYLPNARLSILPLSMRMAGPREAVWHAVIRRNMGCTHFIVGRDHAGPSYKKHDGTSFFDPMAAQKLALQLEEKLGIHILASEEVVYCEETDSYCETRYLLPGQTVRNISGTAFRNMLENNMTVPSWYSYPGVISILKQYYERPRGSCYYFVGLSGSGKSTMAEIWKAYLEEKYPHRPVTLLDADIIRTHLSKGLGFSKEDRSLNVRRIGYVASEIVKHGGLVVVANIAPYEADREYNRALISPHGDYVQIYVKTPIEECERRDVKGLYKAARAGTLANFTGVSDPFEEPSSLNSVVLDFAALDDMTTDMLEKLK